MADDTSKICADHLREYYPGLKASHARELVAAFFGYKSHAALLADKRNCVDYLDQAVILIPFYSVIYERRDCLNGLPDTLPRSNQLDDELVEFVQSEVLFEGTVWDCDDIGQFMIDEYLPEHLSPDLEFELEDVIAEANSIFEDISYDDSVVKETPMGITITVTGSYEGYSLDDDETEPSIIDMEITIYLGRRAGLISFEEPEIFVEGTFRREEEDDDDDSESVEDARVLAS